MVRAFAWQLSRVLVLVRLMQSFWLELRLGLVRLLWGVVVPTLLSVLQIDLIQAWLRGIRNELGRWPVKHFMALALVVGLVDVRRLLILFLIVLIGRCRLSSHIRLRVLDRHNRALREMLIRISLLLSGLLILGIQLHQVVGQILAALDGRARGSQQLGLGLIIKTENTIDFWDRRVVGERILLLAFCLRPFLQKAGRVDL